MRTLLVTIALVTVACAAIAQGAAAPPAPPAGGAPPTGPRGEMLRPVPCIVPTLRLINPQALAMLSARLNLTEDQKTRIGDMLTKADADIKPKLEAQGKSASEYATLLGDPGVAQAKLTAAAEKTMKAESDVLLARVQTLFALKALLTPEQNKQFSEFLSQSTMPWRDGPRNRETPPSNAPPTVTAPGQAK